MIETGSDRGQLGAAGKQVCGFAFDDVQKLLLAGFGPAKQGELKQLPFNHLLGDLDECRQHIEISLPERYSERLHVEPVACQHRHRISPLRVRRRTAAPRIGPVDDVVVDERGVVEELHDGGKANDGRRDFAQHLGGQQQQGWPDTLAAPV